MMWLITNFNSIVNIDDVSLISVNLDVLNGEQVYNVEVKVGGNRHVIYRFETLEGALDMMNKIAGRLHAINI